MDMCRGVGILDKGCLIWSCQVGRRYKDRRGGSWMCVNVNVFEFCLKKKILNSTVIRKFS